LLQSYPGSLVACHRFFPQYILVYLLIVASIKMPSLLYAVGIFSALMLSVAPLPTINPALSQSIPRSLVDRQDVDPAAVSGTTCLDPNASGSQPVELLTFTNISSSVIDFHDQNVAELSICGGISGTIEFCGGDPTFTSGSSGTALFNLSATDPGATINISKGRWEGCVRAAQATCPTGSFNSTCIGGASTGNVAFSLSAQ
jgi:hypothetical protein